MNSKKPVGAKIESERYTAETLKAADYDIAVFEATYSIDTESTERNISLGNFSKVTDIVGKEDSTITMKVAIAPSATNLGTAPTWAKLLKACQFKDTVYTGTGYKLETDSTVCDTLTIGMAVTEECADPGEEFVTFKGCHGKVKFTGVVGNAVIAEFEFKGSFVGQDYREEAISMANIEVVSPDIIKGSGSSLTAGGYTLNDANSIEINIENTIGMEIDMSEDSGYVGSHIIDRNVSVVIDPYFKSNSERDWYTKKITPNGNLYPMIFRTSNFLYYLPSLQTKNCLQLGERDGMVTDTITFKSVRAPYDDDFYILQGTDYILQGS